MALAMALEMALVLALVMHRYGPIGIDNWHWYCQWPIDIGNGTGPLVLTLVLSLADWYW